MIAKTIGSFLPKNTILGKALTGDLKGAVSSAKNYVKSGEIKTDIANIKGKDLGAIINKAIGQPKKVGESVTSLANNINTAQLSNTAKANELGSVALAQGSGVSFFPTDSGVDGGTSQKSDYKKYVPYIAIGAVIIYFVYNKFK
jgi:hypothetical protein